MGITEEQQKWILFALLIASIAIPILNPIGLPLKISPKTNEFYDYVDNLPEGAKVWLENDIYPHVIGELAPGVVAVLTHLWSKGASVMVSTVQEAPPVAVFEGKVLDTLSTRPEYQDVIYGEQLVQLGFIPGGESAVAALAADIRSTVSVDFHGNSLDDLPMMDNINSVNDFDMVIMFTGTAPFGQFMRQVQGPYDVTIIRHVPTMDLTEAMPFYPGQLQAMLIGGRGAAEYELLIGYPDYAISSMDAASAAHYMLFGAIVVAQIIHFTKRSKEKENKMV
jgi:hypothetical protein